MKKSMNRFSGPLWGTVLMIALPMAFTEILQQLFNSADIAIVGNFVSDPQVALSSVAAVGSHITMVNLLITLFLVCRLVPTWLSHKKKDILFFCLPKEDK